MGKIQSKIVFAIVGAALCGLATTGALAMPITVPTSLNVGDQYRLAFVTSTVRNATSTDIAVYNSFVSAVAASQSELAALGTTWKAIATTPGINARDNTNTNPFVDGAGVPIFLLNDTILATGNADLWDGPLPNPLEITQSGNTVPSLFAWTGSNAAGNNFGFPLGGASTNASIVGSPNTVTSGWVTSQFRMLPDEYAFYALSGVLTVEAAAIPEPAPLGLMVLGLIGFLALRGKRTVRGAPAHEFRCA